MEGYSTKFDDNCANARLEGVDASYKDLSQVCGRIRGKDASWAYEFLEKAAQAKIPILYKRHNKRLGHRRELGGKKGRYPKKAAMIVLKVLKSAVANGVVKGLGETYTILGANANKKYSYPRMAPKGRRARSYYELARVEIIVRSREEEVPKGVEVTPPKGEEKKPEVKAAEKKPEVKKEEVTKSETSKPETPKTPAEVAKEKEEEVKTVKHPTGGEHKHEREKNKEAAHAIHERHAFEHGKGKKTIVKRELR
jgi:large subunit ribosomal protein L22